MFLSQLEYLVNSIIYLTYHTDIFVSSYDSLACKPIQNQKWCFIFACPMPSMVSGTEQMLRICCWLLEAVNTIRTRLKPWRRYLILKLEKEKEYY